MSKKTKTALILSAVLILFIIPPVQRLIVGNPVFAWADKTAEEHTGDALKRALIAYGSARVTNAFISLLQESEISVQPGGMGVTVAFFQLLDPLNDLIERFSSIMLLVIISLGIQNFLIVLGPWLGAKLIIIGLIIWLLGLWLKDIVRIDLVPLGRTIIMLAIFLRFLMPLMAGADNIVYEALLATGYENAISDIKSENKEFAEHSGGGYEDVRDMMEKMDRLEQKSELLAEMKKDEGLTRRIFNDTEEINALEDEIAALQDAIDARKAGDGDISIPGVVRTVKKWINPGVIKKKVEHLIDTFISLIMVFIINTIVFPLLFLWGAIKAVKIVAGGGFAMKIESKFERNIKDVFTHPVRKNGSPGDAMPDDGDNDDKQSGDGNIA